MTGTLSGLSVELRWSLRDDMFCDDISTPKKGGDRWENCAIRWTGDMTIKNLSVRTRQCYLACVREFVVYHRRDPRTTWRRGNQEFFTLSCHREEGVPVEGEPVLQRAQILLRSDLEGYMEHHHDPPWPSNPEVAGRSVDAGGRIDSQCNGQFQVQDHFRHDLFGRFTIE